MRVSLRTTVPQGAANPRAASIEKQIRKLEEKRKTLLKKLNGRDDGASAASVSADASLATLLVEKRVNAGAASPEDGSGYLTASMRMLGTLFTADQRSQQNFEIPEDPEEIIKQIQLLNLQIMSLMRQLGDDAMFAVVMEGEDEDGEARCPAMQLSAMHLIAASSVSEGHVDGYA